MMHIYRQTRICMLSLKLVNLMARGCLEIVGKYNKIKINKL